MEMEVIFGYGLAFKKIINNSLFECKLVYRDRLTNRQTYNQRVYALNKNLSQTQHKLPLPLIQILKATNN
jgi:hypothetical protein